jgi:hypothetical protein
MNFFLKIFFKKSYDLIFFFKNNFGQKHHRVCKGLSESFCATILDTGIAARTTTNNGFSSGSMFGPFMCHGLNMMG